MTGLQFRRLIEEKGRLDAVRCIEPSCGDESQADAFIYAYGKKLILSGKAAMAGVLWLGERMFNPRPKVVGLVWNAIASHNMVLIQGASSVAKCLEKGTEVLMFDGTTRKVEDIETGDLVMGEDSKPRRVLSTTNGKSKLIRVIPKLGKPWVCNEDHVLSLKCSNDKFNGDGKTTSSNYTKGKVADIPIKEFIGKSKTFKHLYKQYQVGVEFENQAVEFDPYIYGMWIGDGGQGHPVLHNADPILVNTWCHYFESLGYYIAVGGKKEAPCGAYYARLGANRRHPFKEFVKGSSDGCGKRIRPEYKINSRAVRLAVLAGIIDTDGRLSSNGSSFSITTKFPRLANDIVFLARSLGFRALISPIISKIKSRGFIGHYHRIQIGGDCTEIPTKLKRAKKRSAAKDHSCTSISTEPAGVGEYYGFTVDGNHRFLLADFTVTHNSYTGIAWHWLRWHGDPANTTVKIISVTGGHAQTQIFDTLKMMQEKACCKLPGIPNSESLLIDPYNKRGGFTILKIKEGADNSGVMQGFHPLPRDVPHPIYGPSTAVFAIIDEAEEVPAGVWTGVGNMAGSDDGSGSVKATGFYNPKDQSSKVSTLAEPVGGWGEFDVETGVKGSDEWKSKDGWHVVRLDAKKTENVQQRKIVFPNFHTYEDYRRKEQKHNGNSPEYFTMCRGAYPPDSVVKTIFTQRIVAGMRGEFIFTAGTVTAFAGDIAVDGRDEAIATVGRIGLASAFKPTNGPIVRFKHDRRVLQVDQQMPVTKGSTKIVALAFRDSAKSFNVSPKYFMGDRTGNGGPVVDLLSMDEVWGSEVQGIDFAKPATNSKVMDEDSETAEELYEGIHTEVWFAAARLAEFGYIAIGPGVRSEELERQILGRRYIQGAGKKLRCEKKEDYKARLGRSPDHADSFTILVHLFRMNTKEFASMSETPRTPKKTNPARRIVDPVAWVPGGI